MRQTGRTAWITGSSRGIGRAIAEAFAAAGHNVVLHGRNSTNLAQTGEGNNLEEVAAEMAKRHGTNVIALCGDLTKEDEVRKIVGSILERFGSIDFLICNAGGGNLSGTDDPKTARGTCLEFELADWKKRIDLQLLPTVLCCREVAPLMANTDSAESSRSAPSPPAAEIKPWEAMRPIQRQKRQYSSIRAVLQDSSAMRTSPSTASFPATSTRPTRKRHTAENALHQIPEKAVWNRSGNRKTLPHWYFSFAVPAGNTSADNSFVSMAANSSIPADLDSLSGNSPDKISEISRTVSQTCSKNRGNCSTRLFQKSLSRSNWRGAGVPPPSPAAPPPETGKGIFRTPPENTGSSG